MTVEQRQRIVDGRIPVNYSGWCDEGISTMLVSRAILVVDSSSEADITDEELALLREITFKLAVSAGMREDYIERQKAEHFFLVEAPVNTCLVRKRLNTLDNCRPFWQYRQITWTQGPPWVPTLFNPEDEWPHLTLEQLAHDHILRPVGGYPEEKEG